MADMIDLLEDLESENLEEDLGDILGTRVQTEGVSLGDCIEVMRTLPENSVDSIVTDPPYGLGFMGKKWDELPPGEEWARECLRVLKPGGHMIAFGGSRTWHRLAVAIEDAGFEIRDGVMWLYGSGFPKSHDISKALDKMAGAEREVTGESIHSANRVADMGFHGGSENEGVRQITAPATPEAQQWHGWGTALKPAYEPAVMARKPFPGSVAGNVLEHGTGALNIDASRIGSEVRINPAARNKAGGTSLNMSWEGMPEAESRETAGRFPANLILDPHTSELLDQQSGNVKGAVSNGSKAVAGMNGTDTFKIHAREQKPGYADNGGASRFFYVAKAPKSERPVVDGVAHPTVKPLTLMRYLVRMVTPPGGLVLDPFAGSGTTAEAALLEGFRFHVIERGEEYLPLIHARIERATKSQIEALI